MMEMFVTNKLCIEDLINMKWKEVRCVDPILEILIDLVDKISETSRNIYELYEIK